MALRSTWKKAKCFLQKNVWRKAVFLLSLWEKSALSERMCAERRAAHSFRRRARGHICITSNKTPLPAPYTRGKASSSHPPSLNMKSPLCDARLLSRTSTRECYCVAHTFREPNKEMARRKDDATHTRVGSSSAWKIASSNGITTACSRKHVSQTTLKRWQQSPLLHCKTVGNLSKRSNDPIFMETFVLIFPLMVEFDTF